MKPERISETIYNAKVSIKFPPSFHLRVYGHRCLQNLPIKWNRRWTWCLHSSWVQCKPSLCSNNYFRDDCQPASSLPTVQIKYLIDLFKTKFVEFIYKLASILHISVFHSIEFDGFGKKTLNLCNKPCGWLSAFMHLWWEALLLRFITDTFLPSLRLLCPIFLPTLPTGSRQLGSL